MSYVYKTLASDEKIIMRANFNWTYSFWQTLFFLLSFVPLALFTYGQHQTGMAFSELQVGYGLSAFSILLGSLILFFQLVHLWTTEIVVTTTRFIYKTGLISRNTKEVSLNNIEEVIFRQTVWGRLFGYGQIILRGTGVGVIELPNIDHPIKLRRTIEDARSKSRNTGRQSLDDGY